MAPVVEEFFFRGFLYQSLRNSWGVVAGRARQRPAIFGAIHLELDNFVPLAILGMALALLFEKTGSLWPCIMLHALTTRSRSSHVMRSELRSAWTYGAATAVRACCACARRSERR